MTDRPGLLCLGGFARHDWALLWQRQQAVMTRLARRFDVYYVERFSTRRLSGRELLATALRRLFSRRTHAGSDRIDGLRFVNPRVSPFHGSAFWRRRNLRALERAIETIWPRDLRRAVLWIYNPSYPALDLLERTASQWEHTVYDCVQRFEFNRFYPPDIGAIDREIARRVDLVFADSRTIADEKEPLNPATHFIPQGVDAERFLHVGANCTPPDEIRWLRRPILGYHGGWHQAFDDDLVAATANTIEGSTFLFIGPARGHDREFSARCGGAVFLPPREHQRVGRFVNAFNVCLIPYRLDEHTRGVFPTKFFEYVATGLPIVSTELPDLRDYPDWVSLARSRDEFIDAVQAAIRLPRRPPAEVRPFVEQQSWDRRVEQMLELLEPG
jgi:glycosyltransferase involved in cell wall biosynthesis